MTVDPFTRDDVVAAIAARGTPPHMIAIAAGVSRHVLEAAVAGDPDALTVEEAGRVGGVLGLGGRFLDVPPARHENDGRRVLAAAHRVIADDERHRVHDPESPWAQAAVRAGVDFDAAYGGRAA